MHLYRLARRKYAESLYAYESLCAPLGDEWLSGQESLLLRVPSAIVAHEHNVLINPLHEAMKLVKVVDALPFMIDQRMYGASNSKHMRC